MTLSSSPTTTININNNEVTTTLTKMNNKKVDELLNAINDNDTELVLKLVRSCPSVLNEQADNLIVKNMNDDYVILKNWGALHECIRTVNIELLSFLCCFDGINLEVREGGDDKETPLFFSLYLDDLRFSRVLLNSGADVNAEDAYGWSPLMVAVRRRSFEHIALLLKHGALVYGSSDENGVGALELAEEMLSLHPCYTPEESRDLNFKTQEMIDSLKAAAARQSIGGNFAGLVKRA